MNTILVINGSPKGKNSITLHTCLFLEKKFPGYKFFKSHGQYDFPQKKWWTSWMMYLVGGMMNNPKLKRKLGGKMSEGMIAPYKKVVDSL